jgi:Putative Ig domain
MISALIKGYSVLAMGILPTLLLALGLSTLTGCGGQTSYPSAITISGPSTVTIAPGASANFTAVVTGGPLNAGVTWSLTNCTPTATACGTLSNITTSFVTYTAPASVTTSFTVTLTASAVGKPSVTQTVTLNVGVPLSITTRAGALPGATFGSAYTAALSATGGFTPYTWSITQGALPAGLALSSTTGAITGTPTSAGTASFTVTLTDSSSPALQASSAFTITAIYPPLLVTTTSLPHGIEGTEYSAMLTATGGSSSGYTWSVISGTALSDVGLTLSPSGAITGTPTAGETAAPVTVQVTDSAGNKATAAFTLTVTAVAFQGQVLSGATPVNGATIQLYAAGATGNASAATPMLTQPVLSDPLGMFQLTGNFTCGQSSTGTAIPATAQLYLVATGGTTSTTSNTSNPALTMVTAVGPCSNLTSTSFDTLNELTTAAAAWSLAPFASSATTLGASSTNTLGMTNAFLDAALLANPATGATATLPANLTVEAAKLAALADALSTCATTTCSALFTAATPPSGTTPTDTFTAALNIVHNPGQNVAAVFATIPATPPFPTTLTASPNDWTMSLTVTGGGLFMPTALGVDSQNNIWVANQDGPLSAFSAQGTPLSSTGYGGGSIAQVYGLAIDPSNNVWVTNYNGGGGGGSVTKFFGVNDPSTLGAFTSTADSICYPTAAAADTNGNIFVANEECSSATILNSTGAAVTPYLGASFNLAATPLFLAVDTAHGFWLSDNDNTIAHIAAPTAAYPSGQLLSHPTCCYNSHGLVLDAQGNVWVANYLNSSFSEVGPDGTVLINQKPLDSNRATPYSAAIDAAQNVWFTSLDSSSILEVAGSSSATTPGTELSPSTGVHGKGGFGLDASLIEPYGLAPDRSGNLWVSNDGQNTLVMFFGLATPTVTPLQPTPTAP